MTVPRAIAPLYATPALRRPRARLGSPAHATRSAVRAKSRFDLAFVAGRQPVRVAGGRDALALDRRVRRRPERAQELARRRAAARIRTRPPRGATWSPTLARRARARAVRAAATGPRPPRRLSTCAAAALCRAARRRAARRSSMWPRGPLGARSPSGSPRAGSRRCGRPAAARRRSCDACDPGRRYASYAGTPRPAAAVAPVRERARCWSSPDTGVAHLARVAGAPTVTLFGPGSAVDHRRRATSGATRPIARSRSTRSRAATSACCSAARSTWVRRCARSPAQCPHPRCMHAIGVDTVAAAIDDVLALPDPRTTGAAR